MSPQSVRTAFRVVAFAEALSWIALLSVMYHKYLVADLGFSDDHRGVAIAGMTHGLVFILYVVLSLVARRTFAWSPQTLRRALFSAFPPFFSVWFEVHAEKNGLLTREQAPRPAPTA